LYHKEIIKKLVKAIYGIIDFANGLGSNTFNLY